MSGEREQRDSGGINVCGVRHHERHSVTGIPPTTRAHSVEVHSAADVSSFGHASIVVDTAVPDLP